MQTFVVFLNELSYTCDGFTADQIRPHVLSCLAALRAVKRLRKTAEFYGIPPINNLAFGGGELPLAAILNGPAYKDEWTQLKTWAQSSSRISGPVQTPHALATLTVGGEKTLGLLWAFKDETFSISIGASPVWATHEITGVFESTHQDGDLIQRQVVVRNIASAEHVGIYQEQLANMGLVLSASSLVYEGDGFVVRMFFNDHEPPHIHVLAKKDSAATIAKYSIASQDILDGRFGPHLERRVRDWVSAHKEELLENWNRVRNGNYPIQM